MNYLIVTIGWLIGMFILIIVKSIHIQMSKKYEYSFNQALKIYLTKDTGPIYLSIVILFAGVFVLPNIITSHGLMQDGKIPTESFKAKAIEQIVLNLREYSILFGVMAQGLGFLVVSKAAKLLNKIGGNIDEKLKKDE